MTAVSLGAQDCSGIIGAREGIVCLAIDPGFAPRKGWRISALDILPGEEQGFCPDPPRLKQRLPGRQVIRLLVDMHELWTEFTQFPCQCRIVVQVEIPVEADGYRPQLISDSVAAFQNLFAAFVFPGGWRQDSEVDAYPGDRFQLALVDADDTGFGEHQDAHIVPESPSAICRRQDVGELPSL